MDAYSLRNVPDSCSTETLSTLRSLPPAASLMGPQSVVNSISQLGTPVCLKSSSTSMMTSPLRNPMIAAIGVSQLAGTNSIEDSGKIGSSMTCVKIDKALMPGSSTPKPPACHNQLCPGCQTRASS